MLQTRALLPSYRRTSTQRLPLFLIRQISERTYPTLRRTKKKTIRIAPLHKGGFEVSKIGIIAKYCPLARTVQRLNKSNVSFSFPARVSITIITVHTQAF